MFIYVYLKVTFYTITECASPSSEKLFFIRPNKKNNHKPTSAGEVAHKQTIRHKVPVPVCSSSSSSSGLPLLQHLQVHAERLLDGLLGDEVDKVLDVGLPAGQKTVNGGLPHHGLGELPGVVWRRSKRTDSQFANSRKIYERCFKNQRYG